MRVVSLEPFLTETAAYFDLGPAIVAISSRCDYPAEITGLPRVTAPGQKRGGPLEALSATETVLTDQLLQANPDVILFSVPEDDNFPNLKNTLKGRLEEKLGHTVLLFNFHPKSFDDLLHTFEALGRALNVGSKGLALSQRLKAQLMDWTDNFYDRLKNKKVTFLAGLDPIRLAGFWIPDLIRQVSCSSQLPPTGEGHQVVKWDEIITFRPDVIIVAPEGYNLDQSMRSFQVLEKFPHWEDIPAVKRGEVVFCDGQVNFYRACPRLMDSIAIFISALAGFDSGYITPRDSFYRLRWLELQRHRFTS